MLLKRFSKSLVFFMLFSSFSFAGSEGSISKLVKMKYEEVYPQDDYRIINVSKRDINRIYCPLGISYYQTSSEKYLAVSFAEGDEDGLKKDMFIKIKPKIIVDESGLEERVIYDDSPKELYVKCGERLYTFILKPVDIPARTIYIKGISVSDRSEKTKKEVLASEKGGAKDENISKRIKIKKGNAKKALEFDKSIGSYEKSLLTLVKYVLKKSSIPGYAEYKYVLLVDKFKQGSLILNRLYEGPVYRVYLYTFVASVDILKPLREVDFAYLSRKPLAISLSDLTLRKGEAASVVIVESVRNPVLVLKFKEAGK